MIIGHIALYTALTGALVSTICYLMYYKTGSLKLKSAADYGFWGIFAGTLAALVLLSYAIMTHQFELNYVYSYSSRVLNKYFLFSTLWAGQEGTLLLWSLYTAIFGLILMRTAGKANPLAMVVLSLFLGSLMSILLFKNPFAMIWEVHEKSFPGMVPADGRGLNPLLQNFWMVIHPPTLFLGYSSTIVAFALAMAGMINRDHISWMRAARNWVLFNVLILGTGIIMGGYWAYSTLGWGGYWAWDPVENASLVPWLFSIVLMHGILVQQKSGALIRTNFLWAGLSFLSMLWGSFLTRSGVLADFSVHSFAASGLSFHLTLLQLVFTGIFFAAFARYLVKFRYTRLFTGKLGEGIFNRETVMLTGMMVILFLAVIVLLGTSAPLYSQLFGDPISLSPGFYNTLILPIGLFLFLSMALAPLLAWKKSAVSQRSFLLRSSLASGVLSVLIFAGLKLPDQATAFSPLYGPEAKNLTVNYLESMQSTFWATISEYFPLALFAVALLSILVNGRAVIQLIGKQKEKAGGYLVHVGFSFMLIGIILSSVYDSSEKTALPEDEFVAVSTGHEVKFDGFVQQADGRDQVRLLLSKDGDTTAVFPRFYYSEYIKGYMVNPDIRSGIAEDIYISPISFTPARMANQQRLDLSRGGSEMVDDIELRFHAFDMKMESNLQNISVVLTATLQHDGKEVKHLLKPKLISRNGTMTNVPVSIPGTEYRVRVAAVNATDGTATLTVQRPANWNGTEQKDLFAVEVSIKPFISLLWFGVLLFIAGGWMTLLTRLGRRRRQEPLPAEIDSEKTEAVYAGGLKNGSFVEEHSS